MCAQDFFRVVTAAVSANVHRAGQENRLIALAGAREAFFSKSFMAARSARAR